MDTIKTVNLTKKYNNNYAIKNLNIKIEKGKIYGLLGRNGAGKSTLLRTLTQRIRKSSGSIIYDDKERVTSIDMGQIYLTEPDNLLPHNIKIKDLFFFASQFYPEFSIEDAKKDATDFELDINQKFRSLSTGYQSIARSILALNTHADFIFLDEPTLGHDVVNREVFYRKVLEKFAQYGNTVLLSTHLIDEIAPLIEDVILIKNGQLVTQENAESLRAKFTKITGPSTHVDKLLANKKVVRKTLLNGFLSAIIETEKSNFDSQLPMGTEVRMPDLQELFIALSGVDDHNIERR